MKINCRKFRSAFGAAILLLASSGISAAAEADREVIPVTLNAGDTYVIKNLGEDTTPAVHVIKNPNALIVHGGVPGQLVLVGADSGEWTLNVTDADGTPLTYKVDVHSIENFANPTEPGKAPAALNNPLSASGKAPAVAALDPGAGPVDSAAASATTKVAAAAPVSASAPASSAANAGEAGTSGATAAAASSASKPTELADATPPAAIRPAAPAPVSAAPATTAAAAPSAPVTTPTFLGTAPAAPAADSSASPIKLAEYNPPSSSSSTALGGTAGGPMIPSQAASSLAPPPPQKFKANPLAVPYSPSEAGPSGSNFLPNDVVIVMSGASRIFDFPRRIRRISLANTEVADIQVINPYQINLIGHPFARNCSNVFAPLVLSPQMSANSLPPVLSVQTRRQIQRYSTERRLLTRRAVICRFEPGRRPAFRFRDGSQIDAATLVSVAPRVQPAAAKYRSPSSLRENSA